MVWIHYSSPQQFVMIIHEDEVLTSKQAAEEVLK